MARAVYIVLQSRGKWWVDFEGRSFGPFSSKNTATMEAISLARFIAHTGREAEVRAPDGNGHFPVEWESAPDRFRRPPPQFPPRRVTSAAASPPVLDAPEDDDDSDGAVEDGPFDGAAAAATPHGSEASASAPPPT